jgi:hypothetical protein
MRLASEASFTEDMAGIDTDNTPDVVTLFAVDRFIARVVARMDAVRQKKAPPREPNPFAGADPDPLRVYDQDSEGRRVLVGLTFHETAELLHLLTQSPGDHASAEVAEAAHERWEDLDRRHQQARLRRLYAKAEAPTHA